VESELLDHQIKKYVILWKGEDQPLDVDAQIQTKDGKNIGMMVSRGLIRKKASLLDENDKIVLQTLKHHTLGASYDIIDSQGKCFAKTKLSILSLTGLFILKDENDNILQIEGPFGKDYIFDIHSNNNNIIAQFALRGKYEKNELGKKERNNVCYLHIRDLSTDRRNLFGLLISFINKTYDYVPITGI